MSTYKVPTTVPTTGGSYINIDDSNLATDIIFIIIIIVIIALVIWIIYLIVRQDTGNGGIIVIDGDLNSSCTSSANCNANLVCDNGLCKVPLGGRCSSLNDCASGATLCVDGICAGGLLRTTQTNTLGDVNQSAPCMNGLVNVGGVCKIRTGNPCSSDTECETGLCRNGRCVATNDQNGNESISINSSGFLVINGYVVHNGRSNGGTLVSFTRNGNVLVLRFSDGTTRRYRLEYVCDKPMIYLLN